MSLPGLSGNVVNTKLIEGVFRRRSLIGADHLDDGHLPPHHHDNRMPAILDERAHDRWLDLNADPAAVLKPCPDDWLEA